VRTLVFRNKVHFKTATSLHISEWKDPLSQNAIQHPIQEVFSWSSQNSTRRTSLQLGISKTTVWRVVDNSLHLNTYTVQTVQALNPGDKLGRFQFVKEMLSNVESNGNCHLRWIFSGEATVCISGRVNHRKFRIGGAKRKHYVIREIQTHSAKVNIGCDLTHAQKRRTCWSCLAWCSIDSMGNKSFWVMLSYSLSSFIFCCSRFWNYRLW
jgi:hypothetical protein